MIKALAFDLDGTLFNKDHQIDDDTFQIIQDLRKQGILCGIATGRPFILTEPFISDIDKFFDFCIANNGGECHDFINRRQFLDHPLSYQELMDILVLYRPFGGNPVITLQDINVAESHSFYTDHLEAFVPFVFTRLDEYSFTDALKLVIDVDPAQREAILAYYAENPSTDYQCFLTQENLVEFMKPGISKSSGLQWFAAEHNISMDQFMVFGDSGNDIDMLRDAGIGVAMGNALAALKEVSDDITLTNNERGIYYYLKRYFDLEA